MKIPLNDKRFINRRNFLNEQAPSAEVIYNDDVHTQRNTGGRFQRKPSTEILSQVSIQITVGKRKKVISQTHC